MDPDAAGQMAAVKIMTALDSKNISSRNVKLPVGVDPGDLNKRQAESFLKWVMYVSYLQVVQKKNHKK